MVREFDSYYRSNRKRSVSKDRERKSNIIRHRDRERERSSHHSDRDRDRSRSSRDRNHDRDYSSKHHKNKLKKSNHSKKSKHRRRSPSSSSFSSYSNTDSPSSRSSRSSRTSKYSTSRHKTRADSSESSSRGFSAHTSMTTVTSVIPSKNIDLLDGKIQKALETIEEDTFAPKSFFSTRDREAPEKSILNNDKVIIDLNAETVTVPKSSDISTNNYIENNIFHPNFIGNAEKKQDKWVRKLFLYRQKYMAKD